MRFEARVRSNLVGFNRLNPQLQERVIAMKSGRRWDHRGKPRTYEKGKAVAERRASTARRGPGTSRTTGGGPAPAGPPLLSAPDQSVIVVPTVLMTKASGNRAARRCTALHPVQ